jgi:1-acyl-sn-glycerol-3-phosphate acyltransferase
VIDLRKLWFTGLYRALARFAFHRVTRSGHPVPRSGAVLYVGIHRNGAIDGAVYQQIDAGMAMTLSSQLRRKTWMRAIFDGIELVRAKDRQADGTRVSNAASFDKCAAHLAHGGRLLFFPEGTSALGARHLPFHPGVARLIYETLQRTPSLTIVPLAAHYEDPTRFQSDVDVLIGPAIAFSPPCDQDQVMGEIAAALEAVGLDCDSLEQRAEIEALAYAATLGQPDISYAHALCALRTDRPEGLTEMQDAARASSLRLHQGIPLLPMGARWPYWVALPALAALTLPAAALNFPVLVLMERLANKLADAPNVLSLWRGFTGLALAALWLSAMTLGLAWTLSWWWAAGYVVWSWLGLRSAYRFRKLRIAVINNLKADERTYRRLLELHQKVVAHVRAQPS